MNPMNMIASPPLSLTGGPAYSAATGGTAAGYLTMNQPFNVGGGSIESAGAGLDGYTKFFLPAALVLVAAAIWLRK